MRLVNFCSRSISVSLGARGPPVNLASCVVRLSTGSAYILFVRASVIAEARFDCLVDTN